MNIIRVEMDLRSVKYEIFLLVLFCIIELGAYFFINRQVEDNVRSETIEYRNELETEINNLMGYKEAIVTGKLGGYAPDDNPMDLRWFQKDYWVELPDSTYWQAKRKNFIATFSEGWLSLDNQPYEMIKQLEHLCPIVSPASVWEIKCLQKSGSSFYLQCIYPYAWGYNKCSSYERQFRPTSYELCKGAFEYLTNESDKYAPNFTEESSKIDVILGLENKYYFLTRIESDSEIDEKEMNRQRRLNNEREKHVSHSNFERVSNRYYSVFCEEEFPVEYRIYPKISLIEKDIFHETLNIFLVVSVIVSLILFTIYRGTKTIKKE